MSNERVLPGLGGTFKGFADKFSDDWELWADLNWLQIAVMMDANVISQTTTLPGSPSDGDIYIVKVGDANQRKVAVYTRTDYGTSGSAAWVYYDAAPGWSFYVVDDAAAYQFDGSTWELLVAPADFAWGINNQTGTTYTLVLTDVDKVVRCANAAAIALTVPTNAVAAFAIGTQIRIAETGVGTVTVDGAGVTLNTSDDLILGVQHEQLLLIKVATDEWDVIKDNDTVGGGSSTAVNTQTGTAYTFALTDAEDIVEMNNAAANVATIPTNAAVAFPIGTVISLTMLGAGITSLTADTGVTLNGVSAGSGAMISQYDGVSLYKRLTDTWIVQGSIGAVA